MKSLPESCSSKCVIILVARKWEREREIFLEIKLEPKSNESLSKNLWEEVRVRELSVRAQHALLGLYLKDQMWHAPVGEGRAQEPLALGWPTCGAGRPQGGPPGAPLRPGASSTVKFFENMVHGQKFARKDVHIIFPKGLKTQKIFLVFFFVKREKC